MRPNPPVGGVSTGEAKVYTSRRTTGITDEKAPKIFEDVTAATDLKNFQCVSGGKDKNFLLEATACTVAVLDFNNDGKPDIYFLNGSTIDAENGKEKAPKSALFRNLGNWKFENVTDKSGLANERWGMGVTVGDYNNDGFADLLSATTARRVFIKTTATGLLPMRRKSRSGDQRLAHGRDVR